MNNRFPYEMIEVLNGVLAVVLLWMLLFLVLHLWRTWRWTRSKYSGRRGMFRSVRAMYRENKPEIALLVITFALCARTFMLWYLRWIRDHRLDGPYLLVSNDIAVLTGFTALMILGVSCWIRVISPLQGRAAAMLWVSMILTSLAFGLGLHYWPSPP